MPAITLRLIKRVVVELSFPGLFVIGGWCVGGVAMARKVILIALPVICIIAVIVLIKSRFHVISLERLSPNMARLSYFYWFSRRQRLLDPSRMILEMKRDEFSVYEHYKLVLVIDGVRIGQQYEYEEWTSERMRQVKLEWEKSVSR
jgi:hypothetical protein